MRKFCVGLMCSALSTVAWAQAAAPVPAGAAAAPAAGASVDAARFGARENVNGMSLSPGGGLVSFIAPAPSGSGSVAFTANLATGDLKPFLRGVRPGESLRWCRFVTDSRLICRYAVTQSLAGKLIPFTRTMAVNADGTGQKELGQQESFYDASLRQFDGAVIDWLPGQGGSVLMTRTFIPEAGNIGTHIVRDKSGLGVVRINTVTMAVDQVEAPHEGVSDYLSDGRGTVRIQELQGHDGDQLTGKYSYQYRVAGSRDWKRLTPFQDADQFVPLAVDATSDSVYALKPLNGRQALYRVKLTDPIATELVASNPRVDIDNVVRSANGAKVIGYTLVEDKRQTIYFDPEYKALHDRLARALPKLPLLEFLNSSADDSKTLMFAGSDSNPGTFYVYDKTTKQMGEVLPARPELNGVTLASVQPVSIPVADGSSMVAYLTLPPGKPAKGLPAVVLPHGGPSARDEWGFDWLAQFLAARGYAVLQPNYRGSAGFGDAWLMENGFKSWQVSMGDIASGARWMASQGIADPNRMAIVGWSYGGYAALQLAATQPSLFKAVAAVAPVTDLGMLKREAEGFTNQEVTERFIGTGPHIRDGSPLQHAAAIKVPVLLAHGNLDMNVGVDESVRMDAALRANGTSVKFLRYPALDHQLEDSAARRELLTQISTLLDQTIGH
ncbi:MULTISPECIES: alpha/beta hydrolase family protein [Sphingomonas]|uniref:alpha/beta hydrolase family protein n=1 Tax=Sphingomonas TaxID=13687 RepID=UPI0013B38723|nr:MULTISPECIES: S9 family peptidase [Sphingomonas]